MAKGNATQSGEMMNNYKTTKEDNDILEMAAELEKYIVTKDQVNAAGFLPVLGEHLTTLEYFAIKDGWNFFVMTDDDSYVKRAFETVTKRIKTHQQNY